ncbi:MAG: hypothetical protein ABEI58_00470 [Candidatus Nanohaloarchaea archaeon]
MIVNDPQNTITIAKSFVLAPLEHPEILPSVLPLIMGAIVIELYFGKHKNESLGWNSSVANAVIWVATGLNLLLTGAIDTKLETQAAYFLVGAGLFVGYMDFFHKWPENLAFRASYPDVVYPLAYVIVVIIKTDMPSSIAVFKAGGAFILGAIIAFRVMRFIETPARTDMFQA